MLPLWDRPQSGIVEPSPEGVQGVHGDKYAVAKVDERDKGTPDEWVHRHPELIRLTGASLGPCPGFVTEDTVLPFLLLKSRIAARPSFRQLASQRLSTSANEPDALLSPRLDRFGVCLTHSTFLQAVTRSTASRRSRCSTTPDSSPRRPFTMFATTGRCPSATRRSTGWPSQVGPQAPRPVPM